MGSQKMLMQQLLKLKQNEQFNLLTGAQLDLKLELIINLQVQLTMVTWPLLQEQSACCQIQQLLQKPGLDLIINLISCTKNEHLFTGMSVKEWKKANLPRQEKTWLLSKKTTKKLPLILLLKTKKNIRSILSV